MEVASCGLVIATATRCFSTCKKQSDKKGFLRVKKWSLKFMITLFGQVRPFDEAFSKILGRHVVHILIIDIFHMLVACERIDLALLGWMELDPRTVIIHSIDQPTIRQPLPSITPNLPPFSHFRSNLAT